MCREGVAGRRCVPGASGLLKGCVYTATAWWNDAASVRAGRKKNFEEGFRIHILTPEI